MTDQSSLSLRERGEGRGEGPHSIDRLDITREVCPMTWVRVKLAIEALDDGATLEVLLRGAEPLKNVPRSAKEDGHEVVSVVELDGASRLTLIVRHGGR